MVSSDYFKLVALKIKYILDATYRLKKSKFQLPCCKYIFSNVVAPYK